MLIARDLMSPVVSAVSPEMTLGELATFLIEERVHGAPVVDGAGKQLGVVSLTDLVAAYCEDEDSELQGLSAVGWLENNGKWQTLVSALTNLDSPQRNVTVREAMSLNPVTAGEECTAGALARRMLDLDIHRIVIMNGRETRGIVSVTDLLRALVEYEGAFEHQRP